MSCCKEMLTKLAPKAIRLRLAERVCPRRHDTCALTDVSFSVTTRLLSGAMLF